MLIHVCRTVALRVAGIYDGGKIYSAARSWATEITIRYRIRARVSQRHASRCLTASRYKQARRSFVARRCSVRVYAPVVRREMKS